MLSTTAKDEQLKYVKEMRINELLEDLLCFYLINSNTLDGVQRIKYVFCLFKHIQFPSLNTFLLPIKLFDCFQTVTVRNIFKLEVKNKHFQNWACLTEYSGNDQFPLFFPA